MARGVFYPSPKQDMEALKEACQDAANASIGDSNDAEIEALRDALDLALGILGLEFPAPEEDDEEVSDTRS